MLSLFFIIFCSVIFIYLICSLNAAILISKALNLREIRDIGSKNPGATNMTRNHGIRLGILTFVLDFCKVFVPLFLLKIHLPKIIYQILITQNIVDYNLSLKMSNSICMALGLVAVLGHMFPVFHKFTGGKGVATGLGAIAANNPLLCFISTLVWISCMGFKRNAGIASVFCFLFIAVYGIINFVNNGLYSELGYTLVGILVIFRHKENISRILL